MIVLQATKTVVLHSGFLSSGCSTSVPPTCTERSANSPFISVHDCREEKEEKYCWCVARCVEPRRAPCKMSYDLITSQPIVIDNVRRYTIILNWLNSICCFQGSGIIKAGFAGDEEPKVRIAS